MFQRIKEFKHMTTIAYYSRGEYNSDRDKGSAQEVGNGIN